MIKSETNFKLFPELLLLFLHLFLLLRHHLCSLAYEFQTWKAAAQNYTIIHRLNLRPTQSQTRVRLLWTCCAEEVEVKPASPHRRRRPRRWLLLLPPVGLPLKGQ